VTACGHLQLAALSHLYRAVPATVRSSSSAFAISRAVRIPTGRLADRATSSLPRTGSDDEQNNHDDDGDDESDDGDRAGAHGVSEPVGINWRPYSVSPMFRRTLLAA
jgi:hypothetical protein